MKKTLIMAINVAWLLMILLGCFSMEAREVNPKRTVTNVQRDLIGSNMGDEVVLSWAFDDRATGYVLFRSTSLQGPWLERLRLDAEAVRSGGSQVDITPDASLMDLCYKVEANDSLGQVIRTYEPICVPKFVETGTQSFAPRSPSPIKTAALSPAPEGVQGALWNLASPGSVQSSPAESADGNNNLCMVPWSFLTAQIREAEPNVTVSNQNADLSGINEGHAVGLVWSDDERASEYIIFRALSIQGPWQELFRTPGHRPNFLDFTPDAKLREVCYRVEVVDASGRVIRRYEPVCVPKFVQKQKKSLNPQTPSAVLAGAKNSKIQLGLPESALQLASLNLLAAAADPPINELCFSNPDAEFTDFRSMDLAKVDSFLGSYGGFLANPVNDVDGVTIDPALVIFEEAENYQINPQVLLTILQREQKAVTTSVRLNDRRLRRIMGWDPRDGVVPLANKSIRQQISRAAQQLRDDLNRLISGGTTFGGWQVGGPKIYYRRCTCYSG